MKVMVISQYFYPEQFRVNEICFELAREGHEITVLTGLPNYPSGSIRADYRRFRKRNEIIQGVKVIRVWLIGRGKSNLRRFLNFASFAVSAMLKALRMKTDFDIILVYQLTPITMALPGILLQKLTGKPLVIYCHDLWPASLMAGNIKPGSVIYRSVHALSKWIYGRADEIYLSSSQFEHYFRDALGLHKTYHYLPTFAESVFEDIDDSLGSGREVNLVFTGNIGKFQSVETIIYAAHELKKDSHIKFHIIGDGASREGCERLARSLELTNIRFYGQLSVAEIPKYYKMATALLVTLKADPVLSYTLPNKVQSYMAARKPIIGAIDGATRRIIEDAQSGVCTSAEDYKGLAELIRKISSDEKQRARYGQNARAYYDHHFSKNNFFIQLNQLLHKLTRI
jgi:glycosyltransferase involved in cell wall biosynthesis